MSVVGKALLGELWALLLLVRLVLLVLLALQALVVLLKARRETLALENPGSCAAETDCGST